MRLPQPRNRQAVGQSCPDLRRPGGGWSRTHGDWYLQYELPSAADGTRRPLRDGVYPTQTDAEAALDRVRAAFTVVEDGDTAALCRIGDIVAAAIKAGTPIPAPEELRRSLALDLAPSQLPTLAEYLPRWLKGRKTLKAATWRSYEGHIRLYLIPYLGQYRIDRLRSGHIDAMYDAIDERNTHIQTARASRDPNKRALVKGQRIVGAATLHRIHATLRKALNDAIRRDKLRTDNPAINVELPPAKPPKPTVWTPERVTAWQQTGKIPSPVMVWTPQHTGTFLDHAHDANDRLYALYHLITFTGLRRGEACGVHWGDLDLDNATLTVRWQLVQHGWAVAMDTPKTDESEATITLDTETVAVLRAHRTRERRERLAAGPAWVETGLVFTTDIGERLHPAEVTDHFHFLTTQAGLPPIRLHDLRHGAATMGLAAGVDMKVISKRLRHSSPTFTQKFYGAVLPELATAAAEATAAVVPRKRQNKTA